MTADPHRLDDDRAAAGFTAEQPPCPPWCVTAEQHLTDLLRYGSQYTHRGPVATIVSRDTDHNWRPLTLDVALTRVDHLDERGWWADPACADVNGLPLDLPALKQLVRALCDRVLTLADEP